ncbi:hypothetical protein BC940DRAFT_293030 [Gongronella butleri]|nr:hypothetical protein BC940DRAFT_293030 [Gongronella butleri]
MDSHRHRDHGTADDERPSRRQEEDDDDVPFGLDDLHGSHRRRDPEGSGSPTRHAPDHQGVDEKHPYERLVEENALLLSQLRCLELTTKHQQEIIANLQSHHQQPLLDLATDGMDATTTLAQQLMQWAELISVFSRQWTTQDQRWQVEKDLVQHMLEYFLLVLPFGTENQVLLNTAYRDQLSRFQKTLGPTFAKWYRQQTVQSLARNPASRDYLQAVRMLMTQHVTRVLEAADPTLLTASKEWQALLNQCTRLSLELHGGDHDVIIRNVAPGDSFDENTMTALDEKDETSENSSSGENGVKKDDSASSPSISPPPVPSSSMIRSPAAPLSLSPASSVVPVSSTAATVGSSSSTAAAAVAIMNNNSKRVVKTMISPIFLNDNDIVLLPARVILA